MKKEISVFLTVLLSIAPPILQKYLYGMSAQGREAHHVHSFQKPWFTTAFILLGMSLLIFLSIFTKRNYKKNSNPKFYIILICSMLEFGQILCMSIALVYLPLSAWQMLKGASVMFFSIGALIFARIRIDTGFLFGVILCVGGITVLIISTLYIQKDRQNEFTAGQIALGCILDIFAQALQAIETIATSILLDDGETDSVMFNGLIGGVGFIFTALIGLPCVHFLGMDNPEGLGGYEDIIDTAVMLSNNLFLLLVLSFISLSVCAYLFTGLAYLSRTNPYFQHFLGIVRSMLIFLIQLAIGKHTPTGEVFSLYYLCLIAGYIVLIFGCVLLDKAMMKHQERSLMDNRQLLTNAE